MDTDYQRLELPYARSPDQSAREPAHHPVIVVGAGPVGLTAAIDLARRNIDVVLLDDDNKLSYGSRAICFAKRSLEIWDRMGCGDRFVEKGVSWSVGKVFFRDELVYQFDLLPESGYRRPAFVNLQQYYCEGFLHDHARTLRSLDIRWMNKVVGVAQRSDCVELTIETPDGPYRLRADYVIACDGVHSPIRAMIGQQARGRTFRDRFLIADVKMKVDLPAERWFWFDPPFHRNQSVLLHRQPDNVWRIDFQLGADADPELEKRPDRVAPRIKALLGENVAFDFEWISVYTFSCMRMSSFRHGRIVFAGDSAHCVSPFGARGANSGVQDVDNLVWKLALVLDGKSPASLLDSYDEERSFAADENIRYSTRSTDFITPKSDVSRLFRDATLRLSKHHPFARRLVNSGRLSTPTTLSESSLNTRDGDDFAGAMIAGAPCDDAPIAVDPRSDWLLSHVGDRFGGIYFSSGELDHETRNALVALRDARVAIDAIVVVPRGASASTDISPLRAVEDSDGLVGRRYDGRPGTFYLIRPDQHVCARWRRFDVETVNAAVARATNNG